MLGMDLFGPLETTKSGNKYVLTLTDYFTKWCESFPLQEKSAACVARCVCETFYRYGLPIHILSDQGREFVNQVNENICTLLNINHRITAAYHPQTNGLAERTNGIVKTAISKLVNDHQNNWDEYLSAVMFGIRTSQQSTTKYTPFFLMLNRNARMPSEVEHLQRNSDIYEICDITNEDRDEYTAQVVEKMTSIQEKVLTNIESSQNRQKQKHREKTAKGVKSFHFNVGDHVLRLNARKRGRQGGKIEPEWNGPYVIDEIDKNNNISLVTLKGTGKHLATRVAYSHLKPYRQATSHHGNTVPDPLTEKVVYSISSPSPVPSSTLEKVPVASTTSTLPVPSTPSLVRYPATLKKEPVPFTSNIAVPTNSSCEVVDLSEIENPDAPLVQQTDPLWIPELRLKESDRVTIVTQGRMLTDIHIGAAQTLLQKQFPHINGFQDTLLAHQYQFKPVLTDSVQILHTGGAHWVAVCTIHNVLYLYNSLSGQPSSHLQCQIASIYSHYANAETRKLDIIIPRTQRQGVSGNNCGLFSIANLVEICIGNAADIPSFKFNEGEMRTHLLRCFEKRKFTPFPKLRIGMRQRIYESKLFAVHLHCSCNMPEEFGDMVQCDSCKCWYHLPCVNMEKATIPNSWVCNGCT